VSYPSSYLGMDASFRGICFGMLNPTTIFFSVRENATYPLNPVQLCELVVPPQDLLNYLPSLESSLAKSQDCAVESQREEGEGHESDEDIYRPLVSGIAIPIVSTEIFPEARMDAARLALQGFYKLRGGGKTYYRTEP